MRKLFLSLIILFLFILIEICEAQPRWVKLNTFPNRNTRRDDFFFINSRTGWVVDGNGYVCKTTDGGYSWSQKYIGGLLRCISFTDSLNGFIGIYDISLGGTSPLYRTTNGGTTWTGITNLPAPASKGFCGIQCVDANTIYAVGRIEGPPRILKSTNAGNNWFYLNIDTSLASRFVDVKFFSPDSGFVSGGHGPYNASSAIILFTSNGGASWVKKFTGYNTKTYQAIWKFSFVNRLTGYGSYNQESDSLQFVKTTDGGNTWTTYSKPGTQTFFSQGIGFLNENTGWIGGGTPTYFTTDGGNNWQSTSFGDQLNRIRFYSDTLGYASGKGFYKYTADPNIKVVEEISYVAADFKLYQNYPNPFNPSTIISYEVPKTSFVTIKIFDQSGKEVRTLLETAASAGLYQINWDGRSNTGADAPSGIYYCVFEAGDFKETRKMVLMR